MPQFTLDAFTGGTTHLNKAVCADGVCRFGPAVHLQKSTTESHDAILHGLDRRVGTLFFGVEPFEPTIDTWTGIPLIFGKVHPEPRLFRKDPMAELDRVNGAIVGEVSDPRIETLGHHKLMVKKNYTDETAARWYDMGLISEAQLARSLAAIPVVRTLLKESRLSHSSGFICPDDGDKLTGVVIPDHILDFEETEIDQPLDRMSVVLNKHEEDTVTETTHLNEGKVMSKKNRDRLKSILDSISAFFNDMHGVMEDLVNTASVPSNPAGDTIATESSGGNEDAVVAHLEEIPNAGEKMQMETNMNTETIEKSVHEEALSRLQKEKDEALAALSAKDAEIARLQKERDDLLAAEVQAKKSKEDADWADLKKIVIPPGMIKEPADEETLRKLCKEDPVAFNAKVLAARADPRFKEEGTEHVSGPDAQTREQKEITEVLEKTRGRAIPGTLH